MSRSFLDIRAKEIDISGSPDSMWKAWECESVYDDWSVVSKPFLLSA